MNYVPSDSIIEQ